MQVKLRVLEGSNAGKEIAIPTTRFMIGRGNDCHLRPKSEAVSRHHCAVVIRDNRVVVEDFGSKNGTFVNGERVEKERELKMGDELRFGPLVFGVNIERSIGGAKRPAARDVKEVAARTANSAADDIDVTDWLEEPDTAAPGRKVAEPETRQYKLDETDRVTLDQATKQQMKDAVQEKSATGDTDAGEAADDKAKKKGVGKLPIVPRATTADSREAAADMLKRFFNRR